MLSCADRLTEALQDVESHLSNFSGSRVSLLEPFGAEIHGLHLATLVRAGSSGVRHGSPFAAALERLMAHAGLLVFRAQGVMSASEQVDASRLFGAGEMHSTHGEHPKAGSEHIFRLSSSSEEGIVGPGAEWHNDGSFASDVFSHAGYHIVQLPSAGPPAGTSFAHLGVAHDLLEPDERRLLRRMASVNSNGGTVHPLIHAHPLSERPSLFLHLAMTGAIVHVGEVGGDADGAQAHAQDGAHEELPAWTALDEEEVAALLARVSGLLSDGRVAYHHAYRRASRPPSSHQVESPSLPLITSAPPTHPGTAPATLCSSITGPSRTAPSAARTTLAEACVWCTARRSRVGGRCCRRECTALDPSTSASPPRRASAPLAHPEVALPSQGRVAATGHLPADGAPAAALRRHRARPACRVGRGLRWASVAAVRADRPRGRPHRWPGDDADAVLR